MTQAFSSQPEDLSSLLATDAASATAPLIAAVDDHPSVEYSPDIWGLATAYDLYECNPATIRDADAIKRFVVELCDLIKMRRFGETQVVHFGEEEHVAGFSMVQLIETSLISAHFANMTNAVYLDVFSCKLYDPKTVADFAMEFFGAQRCSRHTVERV
jgi:S-adenosylmethionine/arginine decarboxylase-like enzyme